MHIFISWSGSRSKAIAKALRGWLPNVIQSVKPWMSESDIDKGARWSTEIAVQLDCCEVGIICITPENLNAPWLLFEAGALSKFVKRPLVIPYLFGLRQAELTGPLSQYQAAMSNETDTKRILETINKALDAPIHDLDASFEKWWPDLEKILEKLPEETQHTVPQRTEREILEDVLELARSIRQEQADMDSIAANFVKSEFFNTRMNRELVKILMVQAETNPAIAKAISDLFDAYHDELLSQYTAKEPLLLTPAPPKVVKGAKRRRKKAQE